MWHYTSLYLLLAHHLQEPEDIKQNYKEDQIISFLFVTSDSHLAICFTDWEVLAYSVLPPTEIASYLWLFLETFV